MNHKGDLWTVFHRFVKEHLPKEDTRSQDLTFLSSGIDSG